MSIRKSIVSLVTAAAILLVTEPMFYTKADAPSGAVRFEAENAILNRYKSSVNNNYSGQKYAGDGTYSSSVQTFDSMAQGVDPTTMPYVKYMIDAPQTGQYEIRDCFRITGTPVDPANAYIAVIVNGKEYKAVYDTTSTVKMQEVSLMVTLVKGTNVIISTAAPREVSVKGSSIVAWVDQDYLDVYGNVTATAPPVRFEAENVILNRYKSSANSNYSGQKYAGDGTYSSSVQTFDSMALGVDPTTMPYVEYMIDAPQAGQYEIRDCFRITGTPVDPANAYIAVIVNGKEYKAVYDTTSTVKMQEVSLMVTLVKGTNVILSTAAPQEVSVKGSSIVAWVDQDYLDVYGNVTAAAAPARFESENSALNLYKTVASAACSNGQYVGNGTYSSNVQTFDQISTYVDSKTMPFVQYTFVAPEAGTYMIRDCFRITGTPVGSSAYIAVIVNGKAYKAMFDSTRVNKWQEVILTVPLKKGFNVVLSTACTHELAVNSANTTVAWADQDYLDVFDNVTLPPDDTPDPSKFDLLESEIYGQTNLYLRGSASSSVYSGSSANSYSKEDRVQTFADIQKNGLINTRTPYCIYTLNAPQDGTYDIKMRVRYGINSGEVTMPDILTIATVVNREAPQKVNFEMVSLTGGLFGIISTRVALKKGTNTFIETGILDDGMPDGASFWEDQDYVAVPKGVTAVQLGGRERAADMWSTHSESVSYYESAYQHTRSVSSKDPYCVVNSNISYASLNAGNKDDAPMVNYVVIAPADGTYPVAVGVNLSAFYSGNGYADQNDITDGFVACLINGGDKQKLDMTLGDTVVIVNAKLKKGENTISVSGALKDEVLYPGLPDDTGTGKGVKVVQYYLDLPWNLSPQAPEPSLTGLNDDIGLSTSVLNKNFNQATLHQESQTQSDNPYTGAKHVIWSIVCVLACAASVGFVVRRPVR